MQNRCQSRILPAGALLLLIACTAPDRADAFRVFKVDPFCPDPSVYSTIQDAVDAAAAYSDADHADYVWISDNASINGYKNQQIVVNDPEDVIIEGGFFDCTDFDPGTDQTSVGGTSHGGPVFYIVGTGHSVYLGNLSISGAQRDAGSKGGGISLNGQGSLTLGNTTVANNHAGTGGGIYVEQYGGDVSLTLLANTLIYFNSADSDGGGIALVGYQPGTAGGYALLYADSPNTWIAFNDAGGNGGGLFLKWFAQANIGSPGYGALGVLYNNSAVNGGAIAIASLDPNTELKTGPMATLYTTDPSHPVRLQSNTATQFGGAVYVDSGPGNEACFVAYDFRIDDSIAPEGAAIHTEGLLANVLFNNSAYCPQHIPHLPNQACAAGTVCNSLDGNGARDSGGNPTAGATIRFNTDGRLLADRVSLRGNIGGNVVHSSSDIESFVSISDSLIADNTMSGDLLQFANYSKDQHFELRSVTLTHNAIDGPNVIYVQSAFNLYGTIIDQPGKTAVDRAGPSGAAFDTSGNLVSDPSMLVYPGFTEGTPTFVDAGGGNYHLMPWSLGVDFAAYFWGGTQDLDGSPRVVDLTSIPNAPGITLDAGAYEVQYVCAADEVFCSGFEH